MPVFSKFLLRISNWQTLLFLVALVLLFNFYIFPYGFQSSAGIKNKLPLIDLQFGYNPEKVKRIAAMYVGKIKAAYLQTIKITDTVYPVIYFLLLSVALGIVFFKRKKPTSCQWLNLLPLSIVVFDYAENICIVKLLTANSSGNIDGIAIACSLFTLCKWLMVWLCVTVLLYGIIVNTMLRFNLVNFLKKNH